MWLLNRKYPPTFLISEAQFAPLEGCRDLDDVLKQEKHFVREDGSLLFYTSMVGLKVRMGDLQPSTCSASHFYTGHFAQLLNFPCIFILILYFIFSLWTAHQEVFIRHVISQYIRCFVHVFANLNIKFTWIFCPFISLYEKHFSITG